MLIRYFLYYLNFRFQLKALNLNRSVNQSLTSESRLANISDTLKRCECFQERSRSPFSARPRSS